MTPPRPALYLARASYRRRRAMDAARLLPFVGIFLLVLPRMWGVETDAEAPGAATAREGVYLFAVWAGLVLAAAGLARWLRVTPEGEAAEGGGEGGAEGGTQAPGEAARPPRPPAGPPAEAGGAPR